MILRIVLFIALINTFSISSSHSKNFKSIFNFNFELKDGYQSFNKNNLYDVYDHSNNDPLIKKQIDLAKNRLKKQKIELLYNFSSHPLNNINILVFNEDYLVNEKKVLKQCKKILKIEKKNRKKKSKIKRVQNAQLSIFC